MQIFVTKLLDMRHMPYQEHIFLCFTCDFTGHITLNVNMCSVSQQVCHDIFNSDAILHI